MATKMELVKSETPPQCLQVDVSKVDPEINDADRERFFRIIDTALTEEQRIRIATPEQVYPMQTEVLAVHWHPEFVPMDLIGQRVRAMFPQAQESLIIPTQHNVIMSWNGHSGVEVDCYSRGFNRKVQLLLHFREERLDERADVLKSMLSHTFTYRGSQLFEFMDAVMNPAAYREEQRQKAAGRTGAGLDIVQFASILTGKLKTLLEDNWRETPRDMVKNKLIRNWFDLLRNEYGDKVIERTQVYLKEIKKQVKEDFSLKFFYRASEVIEEARSLGAGIVIPHPEQFWPILLADYDVDGYEVWNPQSREYTEFLITVVNRHNKSRTANSRPLLVFMGDDCHMGEKAKDPEHQDPEKADRQIGLQPAWDDMAIRKQLVVSGMDRERIIREYAARLN